MSRSTRTHAVLHAYEFDSAGCHLERRRTDYIDHELQDHLVVESRERGFAERSRECQSASFAYLSLLSRLDTLETPEQERYLWWMS
jgi:hypothetical protein